MYPDYVQVELPSVYSQADAVWIYEQLQRLTPSVRPKIALKYAEVYEEAFEAEPVSFKQENAGRKEANTRLRLFVKNFASAAQGYTELPPTANRL